MSTVQIQFALLQVLTLMVLLLAPLREVSGPVSYRAISIWLGNFSLPSRIALTSADGTNVLYLDALTTSARGYLIENCQVICLVSSMPAHPANHYPEAL